MVMVNPPLTTVFAATSGMPGAICGGAAPGNSVSPDSSDARAEATAEAEDCRVRTAHPTPAVVVAMVITTAATVASDLIFAQPIDLMADAARMPAGTEMPGAGGLAPVAARLAARLVKRASATGTSAAAAVSPASSA